jgi:hypothetical protein
MSWGSGTAREVSGTCMLCRKGVLRVVRNDKQGGREARALRAARHYDTTRERGTYTVPDAGHAEEELERPDLHLEERAGQTTVQGSHGPQHVGEAAPERH